VDHWLFVAIALLGLLLGPLLNLVIDRLPCRQRLIARPSCVTCGAACSWQSLLPVWGWRVNQRRCHQCGTTRPNRILVVEAGLPLAWAVLWLHDGGGARAAVHLLFAAYFIAIVAIDLEHRLVLNRTIAAGLLAAFVVSLVGQGPTLEHAFIGAVIGFLFLWIPSLLMPGLGMGDVKLAAVIGALVGYPAVFTALTIGVLAGGAAAGVLLVSRRIDRRGTMAYAPYLVVGVALVLFGFAG
jgi:leader peptidase (prepilin peptidase)/N-methyltransferase